MKKILIVFAQAAEAEAALKQLRAEPIDGNQAHVWSEGVIPSLYRFHRGWIAISSVGLHAAQMCVAQYGQACDEVWNLGLAGALSEKPIGALLSINTVGKYTPVSVDPSTQDCLDFSLPHLRLEGSKGSLISSDFPIHDEEHRERLSHHWDLVDMEGYGIAFACAHLRKKCKMWKIVSDFASPGGRELIRKHKAALSAQLANVIEEEL